MVFEVADQLGQTALPVVGLAFVAILAATLLQDPLIELGFAVIGGVLLLSGGCVYGLAKAARWIEARQINFILRLCQDDPRDCYVTDVAGVTLHLNAAASHRLRGASDRALHAVLSGSFAAPADVLHRLLAEAEAKGYAAQDIDLRRTRGQISVIRFGLGKFLWRITDLTAQAGAGQSTASMGLPMLIASREGHIHFANAALRDLIGGNRTHLSQILPDLPVRPGRVHRLSTEQGVQRVRTAEYSGPTGRREIYLFPDTAEDDATDWSLADDFPVPMLKLSAQGRVLMANCRARDLFGSGSPEGRQIGELVEGLGRPMAEWLSEAASGTGLRRPEVVRVSRQDRELYLQIRLGRLDGAERGELVAVLSDLTELKTLESQFVQSQKMQAIGQLAGGVAHDFNNLLTAISGHCDMLLLRHGPDDADHADLQQIAQNANRAAALVSHLLAFSRKQNLQLQVLDPSAVLADHAHLLRRLVGKKIDLTYETPDSLPLVRADRRQLEQVVMNLVVNARDAMLGGGKITVALRDVSLTQPKPIGRTDIPEGRWLVISVADDGPGIPPDHHLKIFEPFFTTKKLGEGTGLGLSTAYGIVKQQGGYIFVESDRAKGTDMQVWLPSLPEGTKLDADAAESAAKRGRLRREAQTGVVLLVEDEEAVRAFAGRALRLSGHTVIEAASAEQALAILTDPELHVDVIVSDVVMPGMDGPTWTQIAREGRPDVAVIFISGYAEDAVAEHQARIPWATFLPKPFSLTTLTEKVAAQLH